MHRSRKNVRKDRIAGQKSGLKGRNLLIPETLASLSKTSKTKKFFSHSSCAWARGRKIIYSLMLGAGRRLYPKEIKGDSVPIRLAKRASYAPSPPDSSSRQQNQTPYNG